MRRPPCSGSDRRIFCLLERPIATILLVASVAAADYCWKDLVAQCITLLQRKDGCLG